MKRLFKTVVIPADLAMMSSWNCCILQSLEKHRQRAEHILGKDEGGMALAGKANSSQAPEAGCWGKNGESEGESKESSGQTIMWSLNDAVNLRTSNTSSRGKSFFWQLRQSGKGKFRMRRHNFSEAQKHRSAYFGCVLKTGENLTQSFSTSLPWMTGLSLQMSQSPTFMAPFIRFIVYTSSSASSTSTYNNFGSKGKLSNNRTECIHQNAALFPLQTSTPLFLSLCVSRLLSWACQTVAVKEERSILDVGLLGITGLESMDPSIQTRKSTHRARRTPISTWRRRQQQQQHWWVVNESSRHTEERAMTLPA